MRERSTPTPGEISVSRSWLRSIGLGLMGAAVAALVGFHSLLFVERLRDLSIFEPEVAGQWLGTAALLALLVYLKRQRVPLLAGRTAIAFWLLVLLLHLVPAAAAAPPGTGVDMLLALPAAWVAVGLVMVATYGLQRNAALVAYQPDVWRRARSRRAPPLADPLFATCLYARPPPPFRLH